MFRWSITDGSTSLWNAQKIHNLHRNNLEINFFLPLSKNKIGVFLTYSLSILSYFTLHTNQKAKLRAGRNKFTVVTFLCVSTNQEGKPKFDNSQILQWGKCIILRLFLYFTYQTLKAIDSRSVDLHVNFTPMGISRFSQNWSVPNIM